MDHRSFDRLARLLGGASDRRSGVKALVGGLLGAGGLAALDMDADARRKDKGKGREDDGPSAGKKKKRKKCNPACDAGFTCVKGQCACASGVTCNGACCGADQVCRDGACGDPLPACLEFGAECKGTGRRCCDGLTCASGQGGSFPVTCLKSKGAACASTAECPFGMSCTDGACLGNGGGGVPTGASCAGGASCEQPGAVCSAYTTAGAPGGQFCTLPLRKVCTGNPDCTCYNCWYVNDGAAVGGRHGRDAAPVKACVQPKNAGCVTTDDCARGLTCTGGVCTGAEQCAPAGAPCSGSVACCSGSCTGGVCPGSAGCTVTATGNPVADGVTLKTAVEGASDGAVITVGPGTYKPVPTGSQKAGLVITKNITIEACDPANKPTLDGGATVTKTAGGGAPGPADNAKDLTWSGGNRIIFVDGNKTVTIDGIHLTKGTTAGTGDDFGGALLARGTVTLTVKNLDISLSDAAEDGGGVFVEGNNSGAGKLTMQSVNVTQCRTTSGYGGGISAYRIPAEITGTSSLKSKFSKNYATYYGGAISYVSTIASGTTLTIQYVEVSGNGASDYGGGLYLADYSGATASILDTDIINNFNDSNYGGGVYVDDFTTVALGTGVAISGNLPNGMYIMSSVTVTCGNTAGSICGNGATPTGTTNCKGSTGYSNSGASNCTAACKGGFDPSTSSGTCTP